MKLSTFRIGSPRQTDEGLRLGVTRRPPRGVPRARWAHDGYFDVWFPAIAPSQGLLRWARSADLNDAKTLRLFFKRYQRELLSSAETRQILQLLATIAKTTALSLGCFCEDERHCHRSRLCQLIQGAG